jgi:hypothetical protein
MPSAQSSGPNSTALKKSSHPLHSIAQARTSQSPGQRERPQWTGIESPPVGEEGIACTTRVRLSSQEIVKEERPVHAGRFVLTPA